MSRIHTTRAFDVLLVVLFGITVWRMAGGPEDSAQDVTLRPSLKTGEILRLNDVGWHAPRTAVLVVGTTCPACNANVDVYRSVASNAERSSDLDVLVVSAEPVTIVESWLVRHRIARLAVHSIQDLPARGITLTPTVLIVDSVGRVTDILIRKIAARDQPILLHRIENAGAPPIDNSLQIGEVTVASLGLVGPRGVQLLDVRSRDRFRKGHRPGARNIPYDELDARAAIELERNRPLVIDCLQPGGAVCRSAAWSLVDAGFAEVSVLLQ